MQSSVKNMKLIILFTLIYFINSSSGHTLLRGRPLNRYGFLGLPKQTLSRSIFHDNVKEQWFDQKLDHFDPVDTKTWKQRYFINFEYFDQLKESPIFLQLGGEGEASGIWLKEGQIATNYAKKYEALQILLEHRYYGQSHPTEDMSTKNLRYLTSEQALQDAANFIEYIKKRYNLYNNKWIVFGGSYSGSLAAWLRLKYPHLVSGAIASSAPVQALMDFKLYIKVVEDSLGPKCVDQIKDATLNIENLLKYENGLKTIEEKFKLCDHLDGNNKLDVSNLISTLAGNFEGIVQYNKDNRAFEGGTTDNITIDKICSVMNNVQANSTSIDRYAQVNELLLKAYSTPCLDFKYNNYIKQLTEVSFNKTKSPGARQWTYQTCTEFGFFQSSDYPNQPFGNFFPIEFFINQCIDIFGPKFNQDYIEKSIDFTNNFYGGFNISLTNVLFPNGLIDPWHALGVLKEINPTAKPLIIAETAHCADMYPDSENDPQSLKDARNKIQVTIGQFLNN